MKVHGGDKLDSQSRGPRARRVDVSALVLRSVRMRLLAVFGREAPRRADTQRHVHVT